MQVGQDGTEDVFNVHHFFSREEMIDLRKAHELSRQIEDMQREMDSILESKAKKVLKIDKVSEMEEVVKLFPPGFYKTELTTIVNALKKRY